MQLTGAEIFLESLKQEGVDTNFSDEKSIFQSNIITISCVQDGIVRKVHYSVIVFSI